MSVRPEIEKLYRMIIKDVTENNLKDTPLESAQLIYKNVFITYNVIYNVKNVQSNNEYSVNSISCNNFYISSEELNKEEQALLNDLFLWVLTYIRKEKAKVNWDNFKDWVNND